MELRYDQGIWIMSNSWGSKPALGYGRHCIKTNSSGITTIWQCCSLWVPVVKGTVYYGEVIRRLNTVLSPGFSKNVITTCAIYNVYRNITDGQNYVTYFSSRGDNTKGR